MLTPRVVEILVGAAIVGYCGYATYTGRVVGRTRRYERRDEPWKFWAIGLVAFACGVAFLCGAVSWRA